MTWRVDQGDCLELMAGIPADSIDAIVTDPPYGFSFMGKAWDTFDPSTLEARVGRRDGTGPPSAVLDGRSKGRTKSAFANPAGEAGAYDFSPRGNHAFQKWCEAWAREAFRVLKPGGHLLAFGGSRTYHRLAAGVEDAGFEIRDQLQWLYGSGFPKSLDVSKAIDKAAGAEREIIGQRVEHDITRPEGGGDERLMTSAGAREMRVVDVTAPTTPDAEHWDGWGTALKPGHEPIVLARKPLIGTVAGNVLEHGTGALNIGGCRIGTDPTTRQRTPGDFGLVNDDGWTPTPGTNGSDSGRWPANVALDEDAAAMLDTQSGELVSGANPTRRGSDKFRGVYGNFTGQEEAAARGVDRGGASRFYYCAKASSSERDAGLEHLPASADKRTTTATSTIHNGRAGSQRVDDREYVLRPRANTHPTVKPIDLMRWLVRLITPPGGTVLDPFTGSGTTGIAAVLEGFDFVGLERELEFVAIAQARVTHWEPQGWQGDLLSGAVA